MSAALESDLDEDRDVLTRRLNALINPLADRDDLILGTVWNPTPAAGQPNAPAWFTPKEARVTINGAVALGDTPPGEVNPLTAAGRRKDPVIIGLCAHEASHAHSTLWDEDFGKGCPAAVVKAAILLEEPRIERRQIERRPKDRPYLRAQSVLLDVAQFRAVAGSTRSRAAKAAVMLLARRDAGVLETSDIRGVLPVLQDALGADLPALQRLWREAIVLKDGDVSGLMAVAARWVEVVGDDEDDAAPAMGCAAPVTGRPQDAPPVEDADDWDDPDQQEDDDSDDGVDEDGIAVAVADALEAASEGAAEDIEASVPVPAVTDDESQAAKQKERDIKAQKAAAKRYAGVFHGLTDTVDSKVLGDLRAPTDIERRLARQIGEVLRRAKFRDRSTTVRRSAMPPGRLNGRDAMLGRAQRSMGALVTAEPFKTVHRRHVPEPPMTLGMMVDVSGSMSWAVDIMATTAWAFAHAATYVHGKTATVAFGDRVEPVTRPGPPPAKVREFAAEGGWENFRGGFAALDAVLNLTMGTGARLLIVVSDGHFVQQGQPKAAREAVARLHRNGGHCLWIALNDRADIPEHAIPVYIDGEPDLIPAAITTALATALRRG